MYTKDNEAFLREEKMSEPQKNIKQAFGCEACWPESAEVAWERTRQLKISNYLIDESHFIVSLRKCPDCGQSFVSVLTETVGWSDGEDPQYRTVMPLTEQEVTELEAATPDVEDMLQALAPERRSLKSDFPNGAGQRRYWSKGVRIGYHD